MSPVPEQLFRRWLHVHEDDEPEVTVFRPVDYPVPPARGRDGIEFHPDGTAIRYAPGPVDAPVGRTATWHTVEPHTLTVDSGRDTTRYEILTITDDLLRLRPLG